MGRELFEFQGCIIRVIGVNTSTLSDLQLNSPGYFDERVLFWFPDLTNNTKNKREGSVNETNPRILMKQRDPVVNKIGGKRQTIRTNIMLQALWIFVPR